MHYLEFQRALFLILLYENISEYFSDLVTLNNYVMSKVINKQYNLTIKPNNLS